MAEQESFLLAPESAVTTPLKEEPFLPTVELPASVRQVTNTEELAAQLAMATHDGSVPMADHMAATTNELRTNGPDGLLTKVLKNEYEDQASAAKEVARQATATYNPDLLLHATKEQKRIEDEGVSANVQSFPLKAQDTVVERALEAMVVGTPAASNPDTPRNILVASRAVAIRNILAQAEKEQSDKSTKWDIVKLLGRGIFTPFLDSKVTIDAVNKILGSKYGLLERGAAYNDLRTYLATIPTDVERAVVVQELAKEISSNPAVAASALGSILSESGSNKYITDLLDASQISGAASLWLGLAKLARKGLPIKAVKDTAGEKKAGEMAADDLMNGTSISGLSNEELVSKMLSHGKFVSEFDPAKLEGLSSAAQAAMKKRWDDTIERLQKTLDPKTMTKEEIGTAAAAIRASHMPSTNPRIFHAEFGEASASGQKMTLFLTDDTGRTFKSIEAAQAQAKRDGLENFQTVLKSEVNKVDDTLGVSASRAEGTIAKATPEEYQDAIPSFTKVVQTAPVKVNKTGNVEYTAGVAVAEAGMLDDLSKLFRLKTQFVLAAEDSLDSLVGKYLAPHHVTQLRAELRSAHGIYTHVTNGNKSIHLIVLSKSLRDFQTSIKIIAHELGHAFDREAVSKMHPNIKKALYKEFTEFLKGKYNKDVSFNEFENAFRVPSENTLTRARTAEIEGISGRTITEAAMEGDMKWYSLFGEFWAENFAKFVLTDARPMGVVEKWFFDHVQKIKELFRKVAERLGYSPAEPARNVKTLLNDYLNDPPAWDRMLAQSNYTQPLTAVDRLGDAAINLSKVEGKPHIKLKLPEYVIKTERTDPLSYAFVGKYSDKDIASMPWVAFDPKHQASELAYEARVVGVHLEAKIQKELVDFIAPYWRGLSASGRERAANLLREGDSYSNGGSFGKEFSYQEALGKGLSDKEAQAYLAARQLRMMMYHIRNGNMVSHLRAQGLKQVELTPGVFALGKRLSDEEVGVLKNVYNTTTKQVDSEVTLSPTTYVVRFEKPQMIDGELRRHIITNHSTNRVQDITTAIHYRPGEFSRIYSDEYFIRMKQTMKVDGKLEEVEHTIRTARSAQEGREFANNVSEAVALLKLGQFTNPKVDQLVGKYFDVDKFKQAFRDGEYDGVTKIYSHYTRNKDEYLNGSVDEALANGRLFTSKRSEKLLSTDAQRENTLGVFESLEAEITNVSRVASITSWRETSIRRWMNTFGDMIPNRTGDDIKDFFDAAGAKLTGGEGKESLFAERQHAYIMRQIGLRTNEEQYYEHMTRRFTESTLAGNERVEVLGQKIRGMGVLGFIRNINFNLTLGMFNPTQLIVQANGASTAIILSPLHGLAAAKTFPLLRMALMSDNPAVWKFFGQADSLTSLGLKSVDEFVDLVKAVRQTGIIDNIKSTALYNREEGRLNIFNSYPNRALSSHTFFFNRGEEISRLISFDVARREWKAANPDKLWTDKTTLADILVRSDDLTQNMTKANLAKFQEGLLSIPLQFAQYNIKLGLNIATSLLGKGEGRGFTKSESVRLMAGHLMLYGLAGTGTAWLWDEFVPKNITEKMTVAEKTTLQQGLLAGIVNQMGEALAGERTSIALGSRLGSFNYYSDLARAAFVDPKNVYDVMFGPSVTTAKRIGVVGDIAYLFYKDPNLTSKDVMEGLSKLTTEQISSLRNATKAYLYYTHQNKIIDGKGVATAQLTTTEVLAQALGFQSSAAIDVSTMFRTVRDQKQAIKDIADLVFQVQRGIMDARLRGEHDYADEQHKLLAALWPDNTGDLMEVVNEIRNKLYPYDTTFQKVLAEYIARGHSNKLPLLATTPPREQDGTK